MKHLLLKVTQADGRPPLQTHQKNWPLPGSTGRPGRWWSSANGPVRGRLERCANGLHLAVPASLHRWLMYYEESKVWLVQVRSYLPGQFIPPRPRSQREAKAVARDVRLLELLPCWTYEGMRPLFQRFARDFTPATRPRQLDTLLEQESSSHWSCVLHVYLNTVTRGDDHRELFRRFIAKATREAYEARRAAV